jgi:hypothetical protein
MSRSGDRKKFLIGIDPVESRFDCRFNPSGLLLFIIGENNENDKNQDQVIT